MPEHPSFYDQIKGAIQEFVKVSADGISIRDIFILNAHVQAAALHVFATIDNPREHLEEAITDAERAFDEFIVPLDLPWVAGSVERYIEAQIKATIRPGLTALVEVIEKKEPTPNA